MELKNMTMHSTLEQAGGSLKSRRETCRLRPRQQSGTVTIGRWEVGIPGILHGLTIVNWFSQFRTSFGCREKNISRSRTGGVNRTPTHTSCTDAHSVSAHTLNSMITFHQANTRGPWCASKQFVIHVSCLVPYRTGHWLPAQVLSHLPHLSFSRSLPHTQDLLAHDPCALRDSRRSGGSTQIPSPTGCEPKVIEPEDLEPTRIELDRNLGTTQESIVGDHSDRGLTASGKPEAVTEERSKSTPYSSCSLKKTKLDVNFISRAESVRETGCNVFIKEQRTGKPVRGFYFSISFQSGKIWTFEARTSIRISQYSIGELQQQAYAQRLELQDAHHAYIESRREQARLQEELSMKENVLRDTQKRNIHELKNHRKIMRQYSGSLRNCRKCMNRWILWVTQEECQEVESNHSGRLSYVPSQPAMIPSSLSMLSSDKRQFSTLDSSQNNHQGIHHCTIPRETGSFPQTTGTGTPFTRDEEQHGGTIPMPTFARRPSTMSSLFPVDILQNSMVGQQRQQMSELQFDKFPTLESFFVLEDKIQTPSDNLF